jgi:hypothetical protein
MAYTQPTLVQLRDSIESKLRDTANEAFSAAEVDALLNEGIVEVNRLYPLMVIEDVDVVDTDEDGNIDREYTVASTEVSRAEVWRESAFRSVIPQMDGEADSGWDLWGTTFTVPNFVSLDEDLDTVRLYGYQDRDVLDDDADVLESDAEAEYAIRSYAVLMGYQRLQNDRSLYQQWLKAPGNNEMSPNQLDSMVNTYIAQWERLRGHLRRMRRA